MVAAPLPIYATRHWYCAALSRELRSGRPLARRILGRDLALLRSRSGSVHALAAVCPHRGANLAEGRFDGDTLECPYHGWRFGLDGRCRLVPSLGPGGRIPRDARVPAFPVEESQGLVWLWLSEDGPPKTPAPRHAWMDGYRRMPGVRLYPASALDAFEITLDAAHLAFVHRGSLGRLAPELPDFEIQHAEDGQSFSAVVRLSGEKPIEQPSLIRRLSRPTPWRELRAHCDLSGVAVSALRSDGRLDTAFALITPAAERTCWFFGGIAQETTPAWPVRLLSEWIGRRLLREDQRMLGRLLGREHGEFEQPLSVRSDRPALAFRGLYARALRAEGKAPA